MNLSKFILLTFVSILLVNCKKDDSPQKTLTAEEKKEKELEEANEEIYFSYRLTLPYTTTDSWLMIHNEDGELIEFESFENTSFLDFKATKGSIPERFTVTLLHTQYESSGFAVHQLITHTDIRKGSSWYEEIDGAYNDISYSGVFYLDVKNVPGIRRVNAFTTDGKLSQLNYTINMESDGSKTLNLDRVSLDANKEYIISTLDTNGELKYTKLVPTSNLEQLEVDYQDFLDYDSYLKLELPLNHTFTTQGYLEEVNNYYTYLGFGKNGFSSSENDIFNNLATVGYLDNFAKFKTKMVAKMGIYDYGYQRTGEKMEVIEVPEMPSIEILNPEVTEFKFSSNSNFIWEESQWSGEAVEVNGMSGGTNLKIVSSGENGHKLGNLPPQIIEKYPTLSLEGLKLNGLKVYTKSGSYDQYIDTVTKTFEDNREGETEYFNIRYF